MSISRRGLIAAGLAVAVVGAVGVTSTLNAGAAQIAEPTTAPSTSSAATITADAGTELLAPPPGLPGGGTATTGGRTKANRAVEAEGAAAVGATRRAAALPVKPAYAPKSVPGIKVAKRRGAAKAPAPVPPLLSEATSASSADAAPAAEARTLAEAAQAKKDPIYYYSQAAQVAENSGAYGYVTVAKPHLVERDYHSLAEIAVRTVGGVKQAVEVGWTVDREVNNGSDQPHLFVYHWVDDKKSCYNACGWVQFSPLTKPGMQLIPGSTKRLGILHSGAAWWISVDNEWIGYFPDTLWGGRFTKADAAQWFGEVALDGEESCTDMGNSLAAGSDDAATITRMALYGGPPLQVVAEATRSDWYSVELSRGGNAMRYGGTGAC